MLSTNGKLVTLAVSLELSAITLLFLSSNSTWLIYQYFFLHALASLAITPVAWTLMPANYKHPRLWVMFLLFSLSFFIPIIGLFGFTIGSLVASRLPYFNNTHQIKIVHSPEYELPKHNNETGWRSARVRQQLTDKDTPVELRMKALLSLQNMPARHASSILREALSDSSDDLRLLAYGMLDSREKHITHRIQLALISYQKAISNQERYLPARELAELYWELVYQNLVQGDMRNFALEQVQKYTTEALKEKVKDAGLWSISGRMWTIRGDYIRATGCFSTAIKQGFPLARAEPYLAELAFLRQDYQTTRRIMKNLSERGGSRPLLMASDYWSK
ncbi:MAG TPA: hypothetical protein PKI88_00035 [Agitococcus sp.]|nr:hypothetical protein [Agitococcus sp.]HNL35479.1 hypothetical protein [Agitococcus sp.]